VKDLVEFIAKKLVKKPEEVSVSSIESEEQIVLQLKVEKEDMGRIIGKNGKTIKAIRTIINIASAKLGKKVNLEVLE